MLTCMQVANYLLSKADEEAGDAISNLKLQKLVYYVQGFSLAMNDRPMFEDDIFAWQHGPVVPSLYHAFKNNGAYGIPKPVNFDASAIPEEDRELMDEVYDVYGQFSAWKLRNMTHEEAPWKNAPTNGVITKESMKNFFKGLVSDEETNQTASA